MLHITEHKKPSLKMYNMISINTSTLNNPFCKKMMKNDDLICARCYAKTLEKFRHQVEDKFLQNHFIAERKLKDNEIPKLNTLYCRFNAFGELLSKTHYFNLISIVEANPLTTFALWTKRGNWLQQYIKSVDNLLYVHSSPRMNVPDSLPKNFHKVFTVYNTKFIRENNININCSQSCFDCLKCYTHNEIVHINEKVRSS